MDPFIYKFLIFLVILMFFAYIPFFFIKIFVVEEIKDKYPELCIELGKPSSFITTPNSINFVLYFIFIGNFKKHKLNNELIKSCGKLQKLSWFIFVVFVILFVNFLK